MKRAMAKQAEAERERRAVIIASQGELSAAENLQKAAVMLAKSKGALHLRTLQQTMESKRTGLVHMAQPDHHTVHQRRKGPRDEQAGIGSSA